MVKANAKKIAFVALLITMTGCTHSLKSRNADVAVGTSSPFSVFNGEYENTEAIKRRPPKSIAVLPFVGDPEDFTLKLTSEDPREIVRTGLYNQIASLPYRDQEMHITDARLERAGYFSAEDVHETLEKNHRKLAETLGADAAITGKVTHFDRVFAGFGSQVAVGCEVRMVDLETGELLWQAEHVSRGFAGGVSVSPIGMIINAVASLWNLRQVQLYRETDNLFREMAATIYVPADISENRTRPPAILMFSAMDADKTYAAGEEAAFRLLGDPGVRAYVDIEGLKQSVELTPLPPDAGRDLKTQIVEKIAKRRAEGGFTVSGSDISELEAKLDKMQVYTGVFPVPAGFERHGAAATATLISEQGVPARMAHPGGLNFDAVPPPAVSGLQAEPLHEKVRLSWKPASGDDLEFYEIFTSHGAGHPFTKSGESLSTAHMVNGLANFEKTFFKVRAVDGAGNRGPFGSAAEAMPAPEPGLAALEVPGSVLSGEIKGKIFVPGESGPYRIDGSLSVPSGSAMIVGPGANLRFSSGAELVVQGEIAVYGTPDTPVTFSALDEASGPGAFGGIFLDSAERALFRHTRISGARVGISVKNSSPDISGVIITDSSQAGLHLMEGASPTITGSIIKDNKGLGGLIMEGEGLAPCIRSTVFGRNTAFDVQNYAPIMIDLSGNYWSGPENPKVLGKLKIEPKLGIPPEAVQ